MGTRVYGSKSSLLLSLAMMTSLLSGCRGSSGQPVVKVSGIVKFQGSPLTHGEVILNPDLAEHGRPGRGSIDNQGEFVISTFLPGDGVLPGDYTVVVHSTIPGTEPLPRDKGTGIGGKSAIPAKYNQIKSSPLKVSVSKTDSGKHLTLDLVE
ncbi:hypothetical protein SH661x_000301 [Planctomicrobium sp. SH661]|uniref:hypothetical protein n=1 Tax=Planctomicrobium sp. SH661 TaxID=3448124 RepID=UPI003F5AE68B